MSPFWFLTTSQKYIESVSSPLPQIQSRDRLLICKRHQLDVTGPGLSKEAFHAAALEFLSWLRPGYLRLQRPVTERERDAAYTAAMKYNSALQHKVPRVQHLSRWHKCLPHTVHSTGHSKSSWVLWALIGLDLARTTRLKWGSGWHCPGLNWKSFNLNPCRRTPFL